MTPQKMLDEFHKAAGDEKPRRPEFPSKEIIRLRKKLIKEECIVELNKAIRERDIVSVADAIADGIYVLYGTAWAFGLDIYPILKEVHRSNMTKCVNGKMRRRSDGKILKPYSYEPPDIASEIMRQIKKRKRMAKP